MVPAWRGLAIGWLTETTLMQTRAKRPGWQPCQPTSAQQNRHKKDAESAASAARTAQRRGLAWVYASEPDKMDGRVIKTATLQSANTVAFKFPYQGEQRGELELRVHPRYGRDVSLSVAKGQFLCRFDGCSVVIRFDDGRPQTYSAAEPADHSTTTLFIRNYTNFVAAFRRAKKVVIEATFYQEGTRAFEFNVAGLNWDDGQAPAKKQ